MGSLGAEVGKVAFVFYGADVGFEHKVELARLGELTSAGSDQFAGLLGAGGGGELIGAKAALAGFAIDHWVSEGGFVSAGLPDGSTHEDRTVHADDIVAELGHGPPPVGFEVAFEFGAEGTVIPGSVETAINLGGLENEPSALAKGHNLFHTVIGFHMFFWILERKLLAMIGKDEHSNIKSDRAEDTTPDLGVGLALGSEGGLDGGGTICWGGDFWAPGGGAGIMEEQVCSGVIVAWFRGRDTEADD